MDYSSSNWNYAGSDYKYEDYYSALGIEDSPHILSGRESKDEIVSLATLKPPERIEEIQKHLDELFRRFADSIILQNGQR